MNKKSLSERDICTKFITPSLVAAGWDVHAQIREEVGFTDGRIYVRGKIHARGSKKRVDYILYYKPNIPLAIIEAKDNNQTLGAGMQQALGYATPLDVPFVFSSNGDGFLFHDKTVKSGPIETELPLDAFPSPEQLWQKYKVFKGITDEAASVVAQDYYSDGANRSPRYYQQIAINRTVEAIARNEGNNRHLLVMATGTGKTYTAFQIIYRLWKSGLKKRILFLADRTALIDQTVRGDFRHFKEAMTVIKHKQIDTAYNIYLALYQGLSDNNSDADAYKQFSPQFFDLVIVDECHRGSARDDSKWREILDYFKGATHIGLTATPKETKDISSSEYFGDPLYTYSLKQGIDDGFLAPYKVVKVTLDIDAEGWRPPHGFKDKDGKAVEDRIYNRTDFDKNIIVEERRQIVAQKITEFLKGSDRFSKTIVFCVDIEHAEGMRKELANANADLVAANSKYVMQITGDNAIGKQHLDAFISPSELYPVIATTSKLMTTGVDAQTCKLIVLDSNIGSMTEFKQIIGRGTRINEDFGKHYFTIMDFRNVTALFADKDFDGDPVRVKEASEDDDISGTDEEADDTPTTDELTGDEIDFPEPDKPDVSFNEDPAEYGRRRKITVNGVEVTVIKERVQYMGDDGKIITESLRDYTRKNVRTAYASLDAFLASWNHADKKRAIVDELEQQGVIFAALNEEIGSAFDPFDLICHVAYEQKPLTRKERAERVKKRDYFTKYGDLAREVIAALLDKYADDGGLDFENPEIIRQDPLSKIATPVEIIRSFGGRKGYDEAIHALSMEIYKVA
ncbi:MAG: hypothetical protein RL088_499 [Verrucomicrobiota bacterium]|jgi:type I restriction enzyme R subunit